MTQISPTDEKTPQDTIVINDQRYEYAGVMKRVAAQVLDACVVFAFLLAVLIPLALAVFFGLSAQWFEPETVFYVQGMMRSGTLEVIMNVVCLFIGFFYFTLQYRSSHKASLGMRLVDIKLTSETYEKPSWGALILRYSIYMLPYIALTVCIKSKPPMGVMLVCMVFLYLVLPIVWMLMVRLTRKKQTYYDMLSKTVVLRLAKHK